MTDAFQISPDMEEIDRIMHRTFGAARMSTEQRARQLETLSTQVNKAVAGSRAHHRSSRLIPTAIAVSLVLALLATGVWIKNTYLSPLQPPSVEASVRLLAAPQPGYGRHIVVQGERGFAAPGFASRWTADIWQRTLVDGTEQLSVVAMSDTGLPQGSYVQNGSIYRVVELDGTVERGSGKPLGVSPAVASVLLSPEAVRDQILGMLSTGHAIELSSVNRGPDQVTTFDITATMSGSATNLSDELGLTSPIRQGLVEVGIDHKTGRVHTYRVTVVDGTGLSHLVWAFTFTRWDDLPASDVDPARFDIPAPSTPTPTVP